MTVEQRLAFLILLSVLYLGRGHPSIFHLVGSRVHKAIQDIIIMKVILSIESLSGDVVA